MYSELDYKAYEYYEHYMKKIFNEPPTHIDYFITRKDKYKHFFYEATINIRKEKLERLNNICTVN